MLIVVGKLLLKQTRFFWKYINSVRKQVKLENNLIVCNLDIIIKTDDIIFKKKLWHSEEKGEIES